MFENAELGLAMDKTLFSKKAPAVRYQLLELQRRLRESQFPVIIVIAGDEGAGKGETANLLTEWFDARGVSTEAFWRPTDEETLRPKHWKFWRALPPKGKIGIFIGAWYGEPINGRVYRKNSKDGFHAELERINDFERLLSDSGALVLKYWFHLSRKAQKRRLEKLEKDPQTRWRVSPQDWKHYAKHDRFSRIASEALTATDTPAAPWHVIEAENDTYRNYTVASQVMAALKGRLDAAPLPGVKHSPDRPRPAADSVITRLDLAQKLSHSDYSKQMAKLEYRLAGLSRALADSKKSLILAFEGNDAAGKGGTIRRVARIMDSRLYRIIPVSAPTDEEKSHPYLWRFWRHVPMRGRVAVFDRTWYGRVLVERIEGFCSPEEWQRAYAEINSFESQLADSGAIMLKFWLAISREEQLRRFREREKTPWKRYKITDEDWRNRDKWGAYEAAACDMFEKTSTQAAPWHIIESNDKFFGRVKTLRAVVEALENNL